MNENPSSTPPEAAREEALFREALQHEAGPARAAFLEEACGGDRGLRERLEALVQAHENSALLLEPVVARTRLKTLQLKFAAEERLGARIEQAIPHLGLPDHVGESTASR